MNSKYSKSTPKNVASHLALLKVTEVLKLLPLKAHKNKKLPTIAQ